MSDLQQNIYMEEKTQQDIQRKTLVRSLDKRRLFH